MVESQNSDISPNHRAQGEGKALKVARRSIHPAHCSRRSSNVRNAMNPLEKTCCFTGHRPKYYRFGENESDPECLRIKAFVRERCEYLIAEKGVTHFISGGAVGLDTWAMEEVLDLKGTYNHITLECALPYAGMPQRFAVADRERYERIAPHLDAITILNQRYFPGCMQRRNEYMVDKSAYVVAVWTGGKSGTGNTVKYGRKCGRTVFLFDFAP